MTADRGLDVLVVGGGPVGLAAGIEARRHGLSAMVVEHRDGPVDKACGEGLMPTGVRALRALGVDVGGRPFVGIRYLGGGLEVQARFRAGPGLGIRRTVLHEALRDRADEVGVEHRTAHVRTVEQGDDGVQAAGVRARWLVAADGLHSTVRRELGLDRPAPGRVRFGLRRHYALAPWADHVEVHWSAQAEAYVTPVADDVVGVAVLGQRGVNHAEALAGFPALQARLRGAAPVSEVRGAGPLRQSSSAVRCGRVVLVGDAAGYVDALTGEGLATGLGTARAAIHALAAGRPQDYEASWSRETRRYRLLTAALLEVVSAPIGRALLVPVAARFPRAFGRGVDLLA